MRKQKLLSNTEIASFCRQTAMIIKAGITPAEGMDILKQDTVNKEGQELLEQISSSCRQGNPFFQSLEETGLFPEYVIKLIALGEESETPMMSCFLLLTIMREKSLFPKISKVQLLILLS